MENDSYQKIKNDWFDEGIDGNESRIMIRTSLKREYRPCCLEVIRDENSKQIL